MTRTLLVLALMMTAVFAPDACGAAISAGADSAWFETVVRAEAGAPAAGRGAALVVPDRDRVLAQMRSGAVTLRAAALAAMAPESLYAGPLELPPVPRPRQGQWGNRIVKATGIVSVSLSLAGIAASARDASENTRSTLALSAGAIGGAGALFNLLRPRPQPPPAVDPNERMRTMFRGLQLGDAFELAEALSAFAAEMEAIGAMPAATDSAMVIVARRYSGALGRAESVFEIQLPHAATVAREASGYASFSPSARGRLGTLSAHVDRAVDEWRARRWLVERSQRVTMGWLVSVDR